MPYQRESTTKARNQIHFTVHKSPRLEGLLSFARHYSDYGKYSWHECRLEFSLGGVLIGAFDFLGNEEQAAEFVETFMSTRFAAYRVNGAPATFRLSEPADPKPEPEPTEA